MNITTVSKTETSKESKTKKKVRSTKRTIFRKKLRENFLDYIKFYKLYYDLYEKDIAKFLNLTISTFSRIKTAAKSIDAEVTMSKWIIDLLTTHLGEWTLKEEINNLKKDLIEGRIAKKELSAKGAQLIEQYTFDEFPKSTLKTGTKKTKAKLDYSDVKLVGVGETTKDIEVFNANTIEIADNKIKKLVKKQKVTLELYVPDSIMMKKHLENIKRDIEFITEGKLPATAAIIRTISKIDLTGVTQLTMFANVLADAEKVKILKAENKKLARTLHRYDKQLEETIDSFKRDLIFDRTDEALIKKYTE